MNAQPRDEQGFALVEMLIAIVVINVALLAILLSLTSGVASLRQIGGGVDGFGRRGQAARAVPRARLHVGLSRHDVVGRHRFDLPGGQRVLGLSGEPGVQPARRGVHALADADRSRRPFLSRRHVHRVGHACRWDAVKQVTVVVRRAGTTGTLARVVSTAGVDF